MPTALASAAANSVVANERLITKVYFPRLVVPLSTVGVGLFDLAIAADPQDHAARIMLARARTALDEPAAALADFRAALRLARQQLAAHAENTPLVVIEWDHENRVRANPRRLDDHDRQSFRRPTKIQQASALFECIILAIAPRRTF